MSAVDIINRANNMAQNVTHTQQNSTDIIKHSIDIAQSVIDNRQGNNNTHIDINASSFPKALNYISNSYSSMISVLGQSLAFHSIGGNNLTTILLAGIQMGIQQITKSFIAENDLQKRQEFINKYKIQPSEMSFILQLLACAYLLKDQSYATIIITLLSGFASAELWGLLMQLLRDLFGGLDPNIKTFFNDMIRLGGNHYDSAIGYVVK